MTPLPTRPGYKIQESPDADAKFDILLQIIGNRIRSAILARVVQDVQLPNVTTALLSPNSAFIKGTSRKVNCLSILSGENSVRLSKGIV